MTALTALDRQAIARVRELAALRTTDAMRQHFGDEDGDMARAATLGALQEAALTLADLSERLGGDEGQADATSEDSQRLDRIRVVLDRFNWEHDDRQLALEAVERIATGSQAESEAEAEAWGGRGPSASYEEWRAEGQAEPGEGQP